MSIFEIRSFLGLAGYYERHENGLKLSIRDRIVGLRLRDMDSKVGTVLTIELAQLVVRVLPISIRSLCSWVRALIKAKEKGNRDLPEQY